MGYKILFKIEKFQIDNDNTEDSIINTLENKDVDYVVNNEQTAIFSYEEIDTKTCNEQGEMDEDFENEIKSVDGNIAEVWISSYNLSDGIGKAILMQCDEMRF